MLKDGRFNRYIAPAVATGLLALLGGTACGGAKLTCESPIKYRYFPGDPSALESNQNTWHGGVELNTVLPAGAEGLRVDFSDPNLNWHASEWMGAKDAASVAMAIGHIGTFIGTQIEAPKGSPLCDEKPDTSFDRQSYLALRYESDTKPKGWHLLPTPPKGWHLK